MQLPQLPFDKKYLLIFGGVFLVFVIAMVVIFSRGGEPKENPEENGGKEEEVEVIDKNKQATINVWGIFDDGLVWQPIIQEFNKKYPNIKVVYSKKDAANYESTLVDAIASGTGPDLFYIHNDWLPKHKAKLEPAKVDLYSPEEFKTRYIDVASEDFIAEGRVFAVPLYTDNLALFYNKKIFDANNLYNVPKTWNDVLDYSQKITTASSQSPLDFSMSGAALGTANNINRGNDVLLALMMQTGTPIISGDKRNFTFNQFRRDASGDPEYPGTNALSFYTSFSDPTKSSYSWNERMGDSVTAFHQGKLGMMVSYSYNIPVIQRNNPSLSFGIAPLPQLKGAIDSITVANYWGLGVSKNSQIGGVAWQFALFTNTPEASISYLQSTKRASPQKGSTGGTDRVFEDQKLYSKTIFKGNADEFDAIFNDMINDVSKYNQTSQSAIDTAARKANEMLSRYY